MIYKTAKMYRISSPRYPGQCLITIQTKYLKAFYGGEDRLIEEPLRSIRSDTLKIYLLKSEMRSSDFTRKRVFCKERLPKGSKYLSSW